MTTAAGPLLVLISSGAARHSQHRLNAHTAEAGTPGQEAYWRRKFTNASGWTGTEEEKEVSDDPFPHDTASCLSAGHLSSGSLPDRIVAYRPFMDGRSGIRPGTGGVPFHHVRTGSAMAVFPGRLPFSVL